MKNNLALAIGSLLAFSCSLSAGAAPVRADASMAVVEVAGTVEAQEVNRWRAPRRKCGTSVVPLGSSTVQEDLPAGGNTIKVTTVNLKRIFREFNVNADNYVLLLTGQTLVLFPKDPGSALPIKPILQLSQGPFTVGKTKPATFEGTGTVTGIAASGTIFDSVTGSYSFRTTIPATPGAPQKTIFTILAAGASNFAAPGNKSLILRLKLTTGKFFIPQ